MQHIISDLSQEFSLTRKVFSALTDESLAFPMTHGGKTIGELAWHIVQATPMIVAQAGIAIDMQGIKTLPPTSVETLVSAYDRVTKEFLEKLEQSWTEESLSQVENIYGQSRTRKRVLDVILRHEIHHRGQIMVLIRQAGLKVPAVYGPSGDEK